MNSRWTYSPSSTSTCTTLTIIIVSLLGLAFLQSTNAIVTVSAANVPVPSHSRDLQSITTDVTVACGGSKNSCDVLSEIVSKADPHGVRCCSETEFPMSKRRKRCDVWAGSRGGPEKVCNKKATYDEAVEHCAAVGARLCTETELLNKCAKNTKCHLNGKLVWALEVVMSQFCNLVRADKWFKEMGLNGFGDQPDTMYLGGNPLFNEGTNEVIYRYDYLLKKFLPWMTDEFTCNNDCRPLVRADKWLESQGLNIYGHDPDTVYAGGTPLFNEDTGERIDRYDYLVESFPKLPWMADEFSCYDCNLARADKWLKAMRYNEYGDKPGTLYEGGTPLYDPLTGKYTYRYDYLVEKFPELPWMTDEFTCDDCNLVRADKWLDSMRYNEYGDKPDTVYAGGNPLFDMDTGEFIDRYDYLVEKFLPWMTDEFTCDDTVIYPHCMTDWPSGIGDRSCDENWNTKECGYDGGDCVSI